jgi:putative endonuclease
LGIFSMYYVYIIYSPTLDKFYIGQTQDLDDRIFRHTNSGSKSTKISNDWILKYQESFATRSEAIRRESEIKKKKSRKYLERLIDHPSPTAKI